MDRCVRVLPMPLVEPYEDFLSQILGNSPIMNVGQNKLGNLIAPFIDPWVDPVMILDVLSPLFFD